VPERGLAMPNYHLSLKIISRAKGRSAVAAAAYRAGEKIKNERDGITHNYTNKGGVLHTEILLPDHVPREYADRAVLWNAVEKIERYKTAQLSREVEFSLPRELTMEQNILLAHKFVKGTFVEQGMCADVCVHDKGDGKAHYS
jgi:ATP-dependent exoDNAse (exonuclease V) alpha subunit